MLLLSGGKISNKLPATYLKIFSENDTSKDSSAMVVKHHPLRTVFGWGGVGWGGGVQIVLKMFVRADYVVIINGIGICYILNEISSLGY